MIHFTIEDRNGSQQEMEIPEGIGLNLMEVMKAAEYNILATCGGMALCATCRVEILEGGDKLPQISDAELDIFDTLPEQVNNCRLACQLRVDESLEGTIFKIRGEE
jgi:ferredoxin